jgi:NTE family protein
MSCLRAETLEEAAASSVAPVLAFLCMLRDEGRRAAGAFLEAHGRDFGRRSTADLDVLLSEC